MTPIVVVRCQRVKIRDVCVFGSDYKASSVNKCVSERKRTKCCVVMCFNINGYNAPEERATDVEPRTKRRGATRKP